MCSNKNERRFHNSTDMKGLAIVILCSLLTSAYSQGNYISFNFYIQLLVVSKSKMVFYFQSLNVNILVRIFLSYTPKKNFYNFLCVCISVF